MICQGGKRNFRLIGNYSINQILILHKQLYETKNKTLLITRIGGSIRFRAAELKVRGLQHSKDKAKKAQKLCTELIVGSVNDLATAKKACQGVHIVLHPKEGMGRQQDWLPTQRLSTT